MNETPPPFNLVDSFQLAPGLLAPAQPAQARGDRWRTVGHWLRDTGLGITGFVVVLGVALSGWTASFIGLHQFGVQHMGLSDTASWLVPITFDGAAGGLSLVVFRASINGRGASLWRALIVVFTVLSSWINWQHIPDPTGRWIASFMPPAAVILFEGLMSEARAAAARRDGQERPRLHPLRWYMDRKGTWAIYRAYVLGIELPDALKGAAGEVAASAVGERPADAQPDGIPDAHAAPPVSAPAERPHDAQSERSPKAARGRSPGKQKSAPKKTTTERRRERTRALYDELSKRPEWTEIRDALVEAKLAPKTISRPTCQRIRDAIEKAEPALAALGQPNVRTLTGS